MDKEMLKSARRLAISLAKEIDVKNQKLFELESTLDETSAKLDKMTKERDRLDKAFNEAHAILLEMRKIDDELYSQLRKASFISHENDKLKHEVANLRRSLEQRDKELSKQKGQIEKGAKGLLLEKGKVEELSVKIEDMQNVETLKGVLISKEKRCNDELQDARKEAIRVLCEILNERTTLRMKRMGEVDLKPFRVLCFGKCYEGGDRDDMSAKLCSLWQQKVQDPHWHPFKKVVISGDLKEIIDEDDEKLKELRTEYGEEAYKAVANALLELNAYDPSGRYVSVEIWNPAAGRKATMKEIIQYIVKQWNNSKRRKKSLRGIYNEVLTIQKIPIIEKCEEIGI